ncbi:hypothetical protein [Dactylosporangium sp. NPDC005555]|uniref:hypothetical protein n=1 Tax=Dactylosporangium sp. NPDC005555 TaxID=3154889 RepID=UPI0033BE36F3
MLLEVASPRMPCRTFAGRLDGEGLDQAVHRPGRAGACPRALGPGAGTGRWDRARSAPAIRSTSCTPPRTA